MRTPLLALSLLMFAVAANVGCTVSCTTEAKAPPVDARLHLALPADRPLRPHPSRCSSTMCPTRIKPRW